MTDTVYHVVPSGEVWAVKQRGSEEASRLAPTRSRALFHAERFAASNGPARIVLHREDGTIERQMTVARLESRDWRAWLTSAPVLTGFAGALMVSAAAALFVARR